MPRPILAVDLDGILCEVRKSKELPMSKIDCLQAKPKPAMINKINKLFFKYFIIIYTARKNSLISTSLDWLNEHNVHFDAFSNKKMPADYYLDDKNIKV